MTAEHHLTVPRTARYYTMGNADGSVDELWIVCHGYAQLAAPFLEAFAPIATAARLIVAPEALSRFYVDRTSMSMDPPPRVGATWMTREDREHEIADQVTYLDALHDHVRSPLRGGVRLRVLGFSQGVATVTRWLARGRSRADEVILWAGSFPPDLDARLFAERLGAAPVVIVAGNADELVSRRTLEAQRPLLLDAGIAARLVTFDGRHRLDTATLTALAG